MRCVLLSTSHVCACMQPCIKLWNSGHAGEERENTCVISSVFGGVCVRCIKVEMGALHYVCVLACTVFVSQANGLKTYRDMFPHKHSLSMKFPPIPGWSPDSNPWDDYIYPPFGPKELTRRKGKPVKVRLTSDSPAIKGSMVSFTAKLEYPPCQKEDTNGELVWDEHCPDGMELEASGPSHDCKRDCH
ncbi:unnamed protein product [Oncorhynchus mykiss]|uniref:PMEL/NMB N-terminal domain-containing protein n=1 Tax=Oncorhynchus mykiss TaxID=8022 RepID=A0A060YGB9_ONCMY|nr:unnamed protein product [Oncorhynchus mykiss]